MYRSFDHGYARPRYQCPCKWAPRHLPVVTYTRRVRDFFRVRWWVRCWECNLCLGPFELREMASLERRLLEEADEDLLLGDA